LIGIFSLPPELYFRRRNILGRHPRESGGPVITGIYWIPAFAGMTSCCLARFVRNSSHRRKERQRRAVGRLEHHLDLLADLQFLQVAIDDIGLQRRTFLQRDVGDRIRPVADLRIRLNV
jgi:hypothetical protein